MSADRIPNVRYPGGWNVGRQDSGCEISEEGGTSAGQNSGYEISGWNEGEFPSEWNEQCHISQGAVCVSKGEGATRHSLGRIPQWVVVQAVQGGYITTKGKTAG